MEEDYTDRFWGWEQVAQSPEQHGFHTARHQQVVIILYGDGQYWVNASKGSNLVPG